MKKTSYIISGVAIMIVLLSAIGLSLYGYSLRQQAAQKQEEQAREQQRAKEAFQQFQKETFTALNLQAEAVLVTNASTGEVVFERNADRALPLASLAKIMTTITALARTDKTTIVTFSADAISQTGDQGFSLGEQVSLDTLIPFMLVTSSNDAGYAIAETVERITGEPFTVSMQRMASTLGLPSFEFNNPTGLDITDTKGTVASSRGSARDVAQLLSYAEKTYPQYFSSSSAGSASVAGHSGVNTNILAESLPGLVVSKTGYTSVAQGNLAFVVEIGPNQPYSVVIMGSTFNGRFSDAKKIVNALYAVVGNTPDSL